MESQREDPEPQGQLTSAQCSLTTCDLNLWAQFSAEGERRGEGKRTGYSSLIPRTSLPGPGEGLSTQGAALIRYWHWVSNGP